jgi:hypothetical protein
MVPMLMRFKIRSAGRRGVSFWFPVVLAWILILALMVVLLPFFLLGAVLTIRRGPGLMLLAAYPMLFAVLWNLSGLHVEVRDAANDILISFR